MKTVFYTYPNVTVCLIIDKDKCARGLAIKSPRDKDDEVIGRKTAKRHAYMALGKSRQLGTIKNPRAIKTLIASGCPFVHKGELNPVLTWQETHLLRLKSPFTFQKSRSIIEDFVVTKMVVDPETVWGNKHKCISKSRKEGKTYESNFFKAFYGRVDEHSN